MSEQKSTILDFLRYSTPGYITYIYFIMLILPVLYLAGIDLKNWISIIGLIFGGIPIGATLGYVAYTLYDAVFDPYRKKRYFGPTFFRKINIPSTRH